MNLNKAVAKYLLEVAKPVDCEDRPYSHFEGAKLDLCDAFLKATGLPMHPPVDFGGPRRKAIVPLPPPVLGFVYVMKNNRNGAYKIGYSKNPSVRENTLQSEEPDITLIRQWPGTKIDETVLHVKFAAQRIRGEWFKLSESDIAGMG